MVAPRNELAWLRQGMNPHGYAKEWTRMVAPKNDPARLRQGMNPHGCAKEWTRMVTPRNEPAWLRQGMNPHGCAKEWTRMVAPRNDPARLRQGMNPQKLCLNIFLWKFRQYPNQNHSKAEISNDNITSIAYVCSTNLEDNFASRSNFPEILFLIFCIWKNQKEPFLKQSYK